MTLDFAKRCADRLVERLKPVCHEVAVVGSIRRGRPEVGNVDLVAVPIMSKDRDLFGNPGPARNCAAEAVMQWATEGRWTVVKHGPSYIVWTAKTVQVDLWWATPETFGTLVLCRTGSAQHNIWLCERAKVAGGKWNSHHGLYLPGGRVVAKSEEEIYEALGLPFLDPLTQRDPPNFRQFDRLPIP